MFPQMKSGKWFIIYLIYTIVVLIPLLISRAMLGDEVFLRNIVGMVLLSFSTASLPCICGYFGKRLFVPIYSIAVLLGIFYIYYVIIADLTPGWGDLTSIIGYLFIIGIGTLTALIAEFFSFIIKKNRRNK